MPDVLMPRLSDTMTEGVLTQWLKHEGDTVHRGDVLAEIETDKATMELEAYDDGVLTRILVTGGTTVPIGQPIAVIGDGSVVAPPATPAPATPAPATPTPTPAAPVPSHAQAPPPAPETRRVPAVRTSPLARALAREHGIDVATIAGSGPGGRIVRADVESAIAAAPSMSSPAPAPPKTLPAAAPSSPPDVATTATAARTVRGDDEKISLTAVRRITAQRLTESAAAPHFYLTSVVDAAELLTFRAELNKQLVAGTGTKVSLTDLLIRACAVTLRTHPQVNSSWGGDHLLRHRRIHVGSAVALDDGLIVPVIRDADRKAVSEIAAEAHELTERARAGRLTPDEFTGGTFTISNLGTYGIDHFTAVINPPEAAILAVGAATEEPVVRDGRLVATTTMKLTLSIDHRVLDGATAAAFLRDLVRLLEQPLRIVA
jgi:pyruvate dehydrogenase E2 component (dihydrolipoamide acetyltransferase)